MRIRTLPAFLGPRVASLITPAHGQTPAQDVAAALQGEFATRVLEGFNSVLTRHSARAPIRR